MPKFTRRQLLRDLGEDITASKFRNGVLTGETQDGSSRIIIVLENYAIRRILFDDKAEGIGMVEGETLLLFLGYFFIREFAAGTNLRWTWEPRADWESKRPEHSSTG
jgi:hypothetical protein